jgi:hypothetical protein
MKKEIAEAKEAVAKAKKALSKIYPEDVVNAYFRRIDNDLEAKEFTKETTIDQPSDKDIAAINAECQAQAKANWQAILDEREAAIQEALKVPDFEGISQAEQAELMKEAEEAEKEAEKANALAEKEAAVKAKAEADLEAASPPAPKGGEVAQ